MVYYDPLATGNHAREVPFAERFGLRLGCAANGGVDAWMTGLWLPFELKTSGQTKTSIAIGREVSLAKTAKYRRRYWLFSRVRDYYGRFLLDPETYFLAPVHMEEFITRLERDIHCLMRIAHRAEQHLSEVSWTPEEARRLPGVYRRISKLGSVSLPWSYVEANGIRIEKDYAANLRRLTAAHPFDLGISPPPIDPVLRARSEAATVVLFSAHYLKRAI